jgi:zinc/manganese transport system substrate-binding protein
MMISRRFFASACLALGAYLVPGASHLALAQNARLPVVATFSILGDFVHAVGGEKIDLRVLAPAGADAHAFSPSPDDAKAVSAAKFVFENGLGFEGWMSRLVKSTGAKAQRVIVSEGVKALVEDDDHHDSHGHHHDVDPHAWQSVANAKIYVANIARALTAADPAGASVYEANAGAYSRELERLDADIRAAIGAIAPERRRIVTTHDAFAYFAAAYGLQVLAPAGVSGEGDISAKDAARVIRQVRAQKIPALFLENVSNSKLIEQIARESGAKIGGTLYADSLSPAGGPAATYILMMRHNISELTKALTP